MKTRKTWERPTLMKMDAADAEMMNMTFAEGMAAMTMANS